MSKYKVMTIAIAVKNNRIAKFGETVDDSELTVNGNALVEAGSLKLIESDIAEVNEVLAKETEVVDEVVADVAAANEKTATEKAPSAAEKAAKK